MIADINFTCMHTVQYCCAKTVKLLRFLTLLPPISLSLRLGSSPPPSSSQTPTPTLPHILVHPYMLRGIFIIILSTSATAYIAFLIRSSRQRHYMSIKSVRMRKHSSRVACLKGHTQVSRMYVQLVCWYRWKIPYGGVD